ncbi:MULTISPECIES: hypothetical protein [Kaistia]|uniref:Uncharacterized protein n=1 Tax=Kaistia nematophila TaxID=2994654 RepID=A0A9X3E3N2_9HYPH|nr:hypothetical protein [Kaistia nematophila]MCX5570616.1 hypothetical protein [Kaistia nematophila]
MAIASRIDSIERDIAVMLDETLSPEARSLELASFARRELAEAQRINLQALGQVPPHDTYVDGRAGAAIETVRPDGVVVFEFEMLQDIFAQIGEMLVQASPIRSGRYARSFLFLADGVVVDPGAAVPPASEYVFVSSVAYARKIERGLSSQAPDGVFQAVAAIAARRFSNLASISFTHVVLQAGQIDEWANTASALRHARRHGRRKAPGEWLRRQPAIKIRTH